MSAHATNAEAQSFKALHIPGQPLLLANVHDAASARVVASLPGCKALATASFSIALVNGTDDANLDLKTYLNAVSEISAVSRSAGRPLTVDLQDGYGEQLEEAVRSMIALGAVGINLEDSGQKTNAMVDEAEAVQRIKRSLAVASAVGVPDFVVNARSDTFLRGGPLEEAIRRGKLYLDAGATSVYILGGGPSGVSREEVEKMVEGLQGKVNIGLRLPKDEDEVKSLSSKDLAELGVSRVSVGPQLYLAAMQAIKTAATTVFDFGKGESL
jgi:2-methylisocitrate lyase-like PEP mutase family enzyme